MTDTRHKLYEQTEAAKMLAEHLRDITADPDDELTRDSIEGETDLHEAMTDAVKRICDDLAAIEGLGIYIAQLTARKDRLKERVECMRAALLTAMETGLLRKYETPIATITRKRVPRKVVVVSEAEIPSEFFKPQAPKLDLKALGDALKDGKKIPGAVLLDAAETISMRWL